MCGVCGCSGSTEVAVKHTHDEHEHTHAHAHGHGDHHHDHEPEQRTIVNVERALLAKNDRFAAFNRGFFRGRGVTAFNVLSGPGAGKTTLLERLVRDVGKELGVVVIEGDQATDRDAARIREAGARVVQINTGAVCHLDAHMVGHAAEELAPEQGATLFIENVGNLVCPAMFDLGEQDRLVVWSVTEGEDKPIKYPHMFTRATAILLTKVDLLPHVPFDVERALGFAREVNPKADVLRLSASSGVGLAEFYDWVRARRGPRVGAP